MKLLINFVKLFHRRLSGTQTSIPNLTNTKMVKFISPEEAIQIDIDLMNEYKFSIDQLMELAGYSCAQIISCAYKDTQLVNKPIFVCCGPGNNGGDGLVCARHLKTFGYNPIVYYPKKTDKELYNNLIHQCISMEIPVLADLPNNVNDCGLIVDALFGFSFKTPVRPQFEAIMEFMKRTVIPIASIDVPSGWDVVDGEPPEGGIKPELLISLTAPKLCAKKYTGKLHYFSSRFIPPALDQKYNLNLPKYPTNECFLKF